MPQADTSLGRYILVGQSPVPCEDLPEWFKGEDLDAWSARVGRAEKQSDLRLPVEMVEECTRRPKAANRGKQN